MKTLTTFATFAAIASLSLSAAHVRTIDGPVMHPEEGFIIGNGDLSCSVYQDADDLVFRLGKGDVWDRRVIYDAAPKPATIREFIDGELKEGWKTNPFDNKGTVATKVKVRGEGEEWKDKRMKDLCQGASPVTKDWPYPCPKPTGELRMRLPIDLAGPVKMTQALYIEDDRYAIRLAWPNGVTIDVEAVIPYDENVLAVKWKTDNWNDDTYLDNKAMPVRFMMTRWKDPTLAEYGAKFVAKYGHSCFSSVAKRNPKITTLPAPRAFMDGKTGCIEQRFYPDNIFKDGFVYRLSLMMDPKACGPVFVDEKTAGLSEDAWIHAFPYYGKGAGEIVLKVTTSRDATLKPTPAKSYAEYRKQTVEPANAFWKARVLDVPGERFVEDLWYAHAHIRRCVLKGGTVPPGLFLPSTVGDYAIWHGDYHGNYNMQSIYWGCFGANMLEQEAAYFDCVDFGRVAGKKIARDYYGTRGVFMQLEGFPLHGSDDHNGMLPLGRMAYMTGWFPEPHWEWYKMTLDREFLEKRGYPFIKDCALFYTDFLKKAPHPDLPPQLKDGKYHIFPSIMGEAGFSGNPMDVCDQGQAVSHCRHCLYMAIEASKALGVDEELRADWQEKLANLVNTRQLKPNATPAERYVHHCYMCSPPEQMGSVWAPEKAWDGKPAVQGRNAHWYQGILTWGRISCVRNSNANWITARDFPHLVNTMKKWMHANGLVWGMSLGRYGRAGAWSETLSVGTPFQEMLLQSWDGSIRLFPRWPKDKDVSFAGWRAEGAFLVSAEQKGGVQRATIFSEKGADCHVVGEWEVREVQEVKGQRVQEGMTNPSLITNSDEVKGQVSRSRSREDDKIPSLITNHSVATDHDEFGRLRFKTKAGRRYLLRRPNAARMDRSKLQIGAYCLAPYARTEAHVKDLADCGIDFVYGIPATDRATLDLCAKYGVGVIATGAVPFWHGMGGEQAGQMKALRPLDTFDKALGAYKDHPAIWMLDYVDEPSALDFPYIGEVTRLMQAKMPKGVLPYINLYPNYAVGIKNNDSQARNQLGTKTYREHVEAYAKDVPVDYLCFDFYLYSARGEGRKPKLEKFYDNFEDAAAVCRATGKSLWYIPQVNSSYGELWLSENMLRFQANLALAYGAEQIDWACWSRENRKEDPDMPGLIGWWTNNVLTLTGEKTEQYAKLKKVNAELHVIGPRYMQYRNVGTRRIGEGNFVVGDMVARDGSGKRAMFVLAAGDPFDEKPTQQRFVFTAASAKAFGCNGEIALARQPDGTFAMTLDTNAAALIVVRD